MTAREFLENAVELNRLINSTEETIDHLKNPQSQLGNITGRGKIRKENREIDRQIKRAKLEDDLIAYRDLLMEYKSAFVKLIIDGNLSARAKTFIEQRYILGKRWKEVAGFMGYTETHTKGALLLTILDEVTENKKYWSHLPSNIIRHSTK